VIEFKGNELGWIFHLAESKFLSDDFRTFIKPYKKLRHFLMEVLARVHPANFHVGTSKTTWYFLSEEEYQSLRELS